MPGMGQPGMMAGGMGPPPRAGTADNPVGGQVHQELYLHKNHLEMLELYLHLIHL